MLHFMAMDIPLLVVAVCSLCLSVVQSTTSIFRIPLQESSVDEIFVGLIMFLHCLSSFSNSFVVFESLVIQFLFTTAIYYVIGKLIILEFMNRKQQQRFSTKKSKINPKKKLSSSSSSFIDRQAILYLIVLLVCQRSNILYRRCREEDPACYMTFFTLNWSSLTNEQKMIRFTFSSLR